MRRRRTFNFVMRKSKKIPQEHQDHYYAEESQAMTMEDAFKSWWKQMPEEIKQHVTDPMDPQKETAFCGLFRSCFITAAGWCMATPPQAVMHQLDDAYTRIKEQGHAE